MNTKIIPNTELTNEQYHADHSHISSSQLKVYKSSPRKYWASFIDPNRPPSDDPTPAMLFGTLFHTAALEPQIYEDTVAVCPPDLDRRTKAGKLWVQENGNRDQISYNDHMKIMAMRASVMPHLPELATLDVEVSYFWGDCKARYDAIHTDTGWIYDLKTTEDASEGGFVRSVCNFMYDIQAAHYLAGYEAVHGKPAQGFKFVCVEKKYPYECVVWELTQAWLDLARIEYRSLIDGLRLDRERDEWKGLQGGLIDAPDWRF